MILLLPSQINMAKKTNRTHRLRWRSSSCCFCWGAIFCGATHVGISPPPKKKKKWLEFPTPRPPPHTHTQKKNGKHVFSTFKHPPDRPTKKFPQKLQFCRQGNDAHRNVPTLAPTHHSPSRMAAAVWCIYPLPMTGPSMGLLGNIYLHEWDKIWW